VKKDLPEIKSLRDVSVDNFNRLAGKLPEEVEKRARHVVDEIERSNQAKALLEAGNIQRFGELMNECHVSLRDLFEVSIPELDVMARVAQSLEGVSYAQFNGSRFRGVQRRWWRERAEAFAKSFRRI
jgi:galactokinase